MRRVAVLYATREGQTRRIAQHVATALRTHGCVVDVIEVNRESPVDFDLTRYAGAVVAASIHIGRHEPELVKYVKRNRATLARLPTLFLSVSLSEAGAEDEHRTPRRRESAAANVDKMIGRFVRQTGWSPTLTHPVAGALLYRQYGTVVRAMMRFIATLVGASTDTSRDHEYTDWQALESFVGEFATLMEKGHPDAEGGGMDHVQQLGAIRS